MPPATRPISAHDCRYSMAAMSRVRPVELSGVTRLRLVELDFTIAVVLRDMETHSSSSSSAISNSGSGISGGVDRAADTEP